MLSKAQVDPKIWYGWILKDPHVVPILLSFAFFCFIVAIGQWDIARRTYWSVFSWLIPVPKPTSTDTDLEFQIARKREWRQKAEACQQELELLRTSIPTPNAIPNTPRITYLGTNISRCEREDMPWGHLVRVTFRNDCGHAISISRPTWSQGQHGITGTVLGHQIHTETSGWTPGRMKLEILHVDPAAVFAVWTGIGREYSVTDIKNRHERKILGSLSLSVDNDREAVFEL